MKLDYDPLLHPNELQSEEEAYFDVVSVLHGRIEQEYRALPERLRNLSEFELCDEVDPNPSDYKMRQNFTDAVALARKKGERIRVTSIYEDVMARQTFFERYLGNPLKVAFFTRPVVPHHAYFDAIFKEGLRKLFLHVRNHDMDPKNLATFMKLVDKAGDRVIGPVAQRIQMHQKQEITHTAGANDRDVTDLNDPVALEAKVREMQAKLSAIKPIEITATGSDDEN